jgi:hypothetical protein
MYTLLLARMHIDWQFRLLLAIPWKKFRTILANPPRLGEWMFISDTTIQEETMTTSVTFSLDSEVNATSPRDHGQAN